MTNREILARMKELVAEGDREAGHMDADWLLCQALMINSRTNIVREIISEYEKVGKWYA